MLRYVYIPKKRGKFLPLKSLKEQLASVLRVRLQRHGGHLVERSEQGHSRRKMIPCLKPSAPLELMFTSISCVREHFKKF
jgi:hypothetical protein